MIRCAIKFKKKSSEIFYSGSVINGNVEISAEKPFNVRSVFLIISGEADVYWTEDTGTFDDRQSESYTANEKYIHTITYLYGSPDGNTVTIDSGFHVYTFSCTLPPELPSSVEGVYGKIRYSAKVVFDRPWKFNKTFTAGITVIKITDLNLENPQIRLPSTLQVQKQFWCCCCASRPLIIEATIPQSGYVSGQLIQVKINLFNESGKTIQQVGVSLKQLINSISDSPSTKSNRQIKTVTKLMVTTVKNVSKEELYVELLVPPVPPTCLQTMCRIVQVNYEVHVTTSIQGFHINPVVAIPIIIGNIPFYLNDYRLSIKQITDLSSPKTPEIYSTEFGLPPPAYEEALYIEKINMNTKDEHPISESNYIPRYPVFKF